MPTDLAKWRFFDKMKQRVWKDFLRWYDGELSEHEAYATFTSTMHDMTTEQNRWLAFERQQRKKEQE